MKKYKIGEQVKIEVYLPSSDFDSAICNAAIQANTIFGIDLYGNTDKVEGFSRKTDALVIEFKNYRARMHMAGSEHYYTFSAWIERP